MSKALVVVDVQNDFCPGGSLAVAGGDDVALNISRFIARAAGQYRVIVATKCWHPSVEGFEHFSASPDFKDTWPPHCIQNTTGAELHPNLDIELIRHTFLKGQDSAAYSGFEGKNDHGETLQGYLHDRSIDEVDVVGIATDYCVKATAIDAVRNGFRTTVLMDLTAAVDPSDDNLQHLSEELVETGVVLADALF